MKIKGRVHLKNEKSMFYPLPSASLYNGFKWQHWKDFKQTFLWEPFSVGTAEENFS